MSKIVSLAIVPWTATSVFVDFLNFKYDISFSFGISYVFSFLSIRVLFLSLNWLKTKKSPEKPMSAAMESFSAKYTWRTVKLIFTTSIVVFVWSLVLIVPGFVRLIQYSQVFSIMKYHIDNDDEFTTVQCMAEIRALMKGYTSKYFILSFIGWGVVIDFIVFSLTENLGIVGSIIESMIINYLLGLLLFYYNYSKAQYYLNLKSKQTMMDKKY